jgi:hypothetical protein
MAEADALTLAATRRVRSLTRYAGGPNVRNVHPDWRWAWR